MGFEAGHNFLIGFLDAAEIAAEAVLIELFVGFAVPEAAGVGADFIREDDGAVRQAAELQLEVHKGDAAGEPEGFQLFVHTEGIGLDRLNLFFGGEIQGDDVISVDRT